MKEQKRGDWRGWVMAGYMNIRIKARTVNNNQTDISMHSNLELIFIFFRMFQ